MERQNYGKPRPMRRRDLAFGNENTGYRYFRFTGFGTYTDRNTPKNFLTWKKKILKRRLIFALFNNLYISSAIETMIPFGKKGDRKT